MRSPVTEVLQEMPTPASSTRLKCFMKFNRRLLQRSCPNMPTRLPRLAFVFGGQPNGHHALAPAHFPCCSLPCRFFNSFLLRSQRCDLATEPATRSLAAPDPGWRDALRTGPASPPLRHRAGLGPHAQPGGAPKPALGAKVRRHQPCHRLRRHDRVPPELRCALIEGRDGGQPSAQHDDVRVE